MNTNDAEVYFYTVEEPDLIGRIRGGDAFAFEKLFRLFYERLCRYALQIVNDAAQAEEIVQDVFVSIWQKREGLLITTGIKPYLYRSVHNRCLNEVRHEQVKQEHRRYEQFTRQEAVQPMQTVEQRELENQIRTAIDKLPPECGKVFRLSRFDELSYREISEFLGISVKTVENQMGKALKLLRKDLAEYLISVLVLILSGLIGVSLYSVVLFEGL